MVLIIRVPYSPALGLNYSHVCCCGNYSSYPPPFLVNYTIIETGKQGMTYSQYSPLSSHLLHAWRGEISLSSAERGWMPPPTTAFENPIHIRLVEIKVNEVDIFENSIKI